MTTTTRKGINNIRRIERITRSKDSQQQKISTTQGIRATLLGNNNRRENQVWQKCER